MSVSMPGADCARWVVVKGEGSMKIPSNLSKYCQRDSQWREILRCTRGDVSISLQASLYRTVGEFFENSSEVRAYRRRAENPAPKRITTRLPVLEAVLAAYRQERTGGVRDCQRHKQARAKHTPFPPVLSSDHFFTFSALCCDGLTPSTNGPTVSLRVPRFTSRVCESKSDALFRWVT
jgi:hypothetical protein